MKRTTGRSFTHPGTMNLEPVEIVFYSVTAAMAALWLVSMQFMLNTHRRAKSPDQTADQLPLDSLPPDNLLVGTAEVQGRPADLAAKAAAQLAQQPTALVPVKVLEQTRDRVVFEALGDFSHGRGGTLFSRGELRFTRASQDRTRIDYAIAMRPRTGLLMFGWLFVLLGLAAIVIGFWLIQSLVVSAANPAIRWQSVQMLQAVHFLWPPFLFGGLYRAARNSVRMAFDRLVHNLPYLSEA